jgi:hypothetical protein
VTLAFPSPELWKETLEELKHMWARLLVYAVSKSRPEAHAAELLTFVWLLLSHNGLGVYSEGLRVGLVRDQAQPISGYGTRGTLYVFDNLPGQMPVPRPRPQPPPRPEQVHFDNTGRSVRQLLLALLVFLFLFIYYYYYNNYINLCVLYTYRSHSNHLALSKVDP